MSRMSTDYRRQAAEQQSDVDEMTSGRWRVGRLFEGLWTDETTETVTRKESLIAKLLGLANAHEKRGN